MNLTALALIGYIAWTLLIIIVVVFHRATLTLAGKRAANSFKTDGIDVSEFSARLCRAHANCYESFPFIGGLLLLALATNLTNITNPLAIIVLISRIAQSTTHAVSTSVWGVQIRFGFFVVQIGICIYWIIGFIQHFIR
ncbi:MAG: MAPEG family protein [Proteobacteria bacterium]|nr:MAPEG family protein [Pseudomonadota bacterium]